MNEQQINGGADQVAGRIRNAAGAVAGSLKAQASGKAQEVRGQAESLYGDALKQVLEMTSEKPLAALGAAAGIGLVLGLILARST